MLTPGPELDRQVAEACGFKLRHWVCSGFCDPGDEPRTEVVDGDLTIGFIRATDGDEGRDTFAPSCDLNDAFWAAEKADFPFCVGRDFRDKEKGRWWIVSIDPRIGPVGQPPESGFITPSLAICAAILRLKAGDPCPTTSNPSPAS